MRWRPGLTRRVFLTGTWNDAHALLDEYRAACRAAAPMQEPPTFMGEPVVLPNTGNKPRVGVGLDELLYATGE